MKYLWLLFTDDTEDGISSNVELKPNESVECWWTFPSPTFCTANPADCLEFRVGAVAGRTMVGCKVTERLNECLKP